MKIDRVRFPVRAGCKAGGLMKLKLVLFLSCALLFFSLSSSAQQEREARLWLTTPDRAAIVAQQPNSLHFSSDAGQLPLLTVDDAEHFQTMDGFGFAMTGGSAELLMRITTEIGSDMISAAPDGG